YSQFEAERIKELADYSSADCAALTSLLHRLVDPLPLIREHIYDNAFAGSFSLKSVAPALLGASHSYDNMPVANGNDAQRAFEKLISPKTPTTEKAAIKTAMLAYCEKDTQV